ALRTPGSHSFPEPLAAWLPTWQARLSREAGGSGIDSWSAARAAAMDQVNPLHIPRNHLVEAVIRAAEDAADFGPFQRLLGIVTDPYRMRPEDESFARPALPGQRVTRTFCGT
ncbi:MAG: hypothetical protein ACKO0U_05910, partial [Gammaproteobacteria bacterium]